MDYVLIFERLKKYAKKKFFTEHDRDEFPAWAIEKIIETNSRGACFRYLFVDYLRESVANKRCKPTYFERKKRIRKPLSCNEIDRRCRNDSGNDLLKMQLADSKASNYSRELGYYFPSLNEHNEQILKILKNIKGIKKIVLENFILGYTLKEIGKKINRTEARVCQILKKLVCETKTKKERQDFIECLNINSEAKKWIIRTNS